MTTEISPLSEGQTTPGPVHGFVASGFEPVSEELAGVIGKDSGYSAQFCAYVGGKPVVDIWGGADAERDSLQGVFSATKGASAVCIALLVQRGLLDLDAPMSHYWPEFAQGGKGWVPVRIALSHQAGLPGVEPQFGLEEVLDHDFLAARLARQVPHWYPGSAHGYHGITIGTLMDELVRRIDGRPIARFFREEVGGPRNIDFFIATPEDQERRVRDVLLQQPATDQAAAIPDSPMWGDVDSLTGMAFSLAAADSPTPATLANSRRARAAGIPAAGGVGSARGLARLYASCISDVDGMPPLLSEDTIARVTQIQTVGEDLILPGRTRFAIVFQKPDDRLRYGSHQAFGHDGAGGAIGVADPWHDLAYGYIPRHMSTPGGADARGMSLARTVRRCLADQRA